MPPPQITDDSGKTVDSTHGIYFMPDWLSFAIALGLVILAGVALRFFLIWVRVPVRWANNIAGTLTVLVAFFLYAFMKAMQNP